MTNTADTAALLARRAQLIDVGGMLDGIEGQIAKVAKAKEAVEAARAKLEAIRARK